MSLWRILGSVTLAFLLTPYVLAQPIPRSKIHWVVENYANTMGCQFSMNDKNIVKYQHEEESFYVALYSLDLGCSGGTAMSRPAFAALTQNGERKIFILPKYSSPTSISSTLPSFIEKIYIENGKLRYLAKSFDFSKDALCCPSVSVEGTIEFKDGAWVDGNFQEKGK
jgi:hypothetical protein